MFPVLYHSGLLQFQKGVEELSTTTVLMGICEKALVFICVCVTAFNCDWLLEPIHKVDVYQVLTHVLGITPKPHNGTWSRVEPALALRNRREGCNVAPSHALATSLTVLLVAPFLLNFTV